MEQKLTYPQPEKAPQRLFDAIRQLQSANPDVEPDAVRQDVLEAQQAIRSGADIADVEEYQGIEIVTPAGFLVWLETNG